MAFDFENAIKKRREDKEKRSRQILGESTPESFPLSVAEEGKNTYGVLLDVPGRENLAPIYEIRADNPTIAIIKACEKIGITEKQIILKNCRVKDSKTGELFESDGTTTL